MISIARLKSLTHTFGTFFRESTTIWLGRSVTRTVVNPLTGKVDKVTILPFDTFNKTVDQSMDQRFRDLETRDSEEIKE